MAFGITSHKVDRARLKPSPSDFLIPGHPITHGLMFFGVAGDGGDCLIQDYSGRGLHLSNTPAATIEIRASRFGRVVYSNGDMFQSNAHVGWDSQIGTGDFTLAGRFETPTAWSSSFASVFAYDGFANGLQLYGAQTTNWGIWVANTGRTANTDLSHDTWYSLAGVRKAGTLNFYVDNVGDGSISDSGNVTGTTRSTMFTNDDQAGSPNRCVHDFWAVWSRALELQELEALHENPYQFFHTPSAVTYFIAAAPPSGLPPAQLNHRGAVGGIQIDGGMIA